MHPPLALAPGLRVVRRGRDRLQVGLTPPRRVVLPRTEPVRDVLHALQVGGQPPPGPAADAVLAELSRHGCLVPVRASEPPRVAVRLLPPRWGADLPDLTALLRTAGARPQRAAAGSGAQPDGVLVAAAGEVPREPLDALVRAGVPHLVLTLGDGGARVGPLVVPGATACLRCVDAHLAEDDPEHLDVLGRYLEAGTRPREDGTDDVADLALATIAAGWAVRDLVAHLRADVGDHPRDQGPVTWSATCTWHAGDPEPSVRRWRRRPGCGCGWAPSGTMET